MPKIVDHRARRTLIAEALMQVAATHGLQAVSLRHVAQEAGVSTGMVQHYFRTKDEMMTFAMSVVSENVQARLAARAGLGGQDGSPRDVVHDFLIEMLPIDEARQREGHVGLAFHAYAAVRPTAAAGLRADTDRLQAFLAEHIREAQVAGDAPAELHPEREARALLSLVEGLSLYILGQGYDPAAALATFETHLAAIFTPPGTRQQRSTSS